MQHYFRVSCAVWLLCGVLLGCCLPIRAVENTAPRPRLSVPRAVLTPGMDARLDDPAWQDAAVISALPQMLRGEDLPPTTLQPLPTEVRLLWSPEYLYIRFICDGPKIYAPFHGHDANYYEADVVEIFFDPVGDGRQSMEIQISPTNGVADYNNLCTAPQITSQPNLILDWSIVRENFWSDKSWNLAGLRTAARQCRLGKDHRWVVDAALPANPALHRLGKNAYQPMELHANLVRYDRAMIPGSKKKRELNAMSWAPTMFGCPHISPTAMGILVLVDTPAGR